MAGCRSFVVATVAVAAVAAVAVALPATAADAASPAPAKVTQLAAYQTSGPVTLAWTNPQHLDRVLVRMARGPHAPTVHHGWAVSLHRPRAGSVVVKHLVAGGTYSVSVWTQRDGRLSQRTTTRFTTKAAPVRKSVLSGQVVDTSGHPLKHAQVVGIEIDRDEFFGPVNTDATGRFRTALAPGLYEIEAIGASATGGASDRGGYQWSDTVATVRAGHPRSGLHLVLPPGGAVRGVVTDTAGHPLAGVAVLPTSAPAYLTSDEGFDFSLTGDLGGALTRADGSYVVKGLPEGAAVACYDPGAATGGRSDIAGYLPRCASYSLAIVKNTVASAPSESVASSTGGAVSGRILTPAGAPAAGAGAYLERGNTYLSTQSDTAKDGTFTIRGAAPGKWRLCVGEDSKFGGGASGTLPTCRSITVVAHRITHATLRLQKAAAVSGVVRGPSGKPLPGVEVSLSHEQANMGEEFGGAVTDARGQWTIGGVPAGVYSACYYAANASSPADPTGARSACTGQTIKVRVGADRIGGDRTLAAAAAVSGRVTDTSGAPLGGVEVMVDRVGDQEGDGLLGETGRDGRFRITGVGPGRFHVCAGVEYSPTSVVERCHATAVTTKVRHTTTGADIALPTVSLSHVGVTVTDAANHPLSGVDVAILRACKSSDYGCPTEPVFSPTALVVAAASDVTGPDGTQSFDGLAPGHYVACALAYYGATPTGAPSTGYADKCDSTTFDLSVTRGGTTDTTIALDPAGAVSGRVTDAAGHSVPNAAVHVGRSAAFDYTDESMVSGPLTPDPRNDILTDGAGRYTVRSVLPGSRRVCVQPTSGSGVQKACLPANVVVTSGATTAAPPLALPGAVSNHYRGVMRIAPSKRIVSPFSMGFATTCVTSKPYSSGSPSRAGCGTCVPSDAFASSGRPASSGVLNRPGAMVTTRILAEARSRAMGRVIPTIPPFEAEYAACPI
jgi:protocatechuate 3,4-dioxygenase beta subunit